MSLFLMPFKEILPYLRAHHFLLYKIFFNLVRRAT